MKTNELSAEESRCLVEENVSYHFFCIDYGSIQPREMVVRCLIFDQVSGKRYLVFTPINNIGETYLREFFGDYWEKRYIRIADEQIRRSINSIIQQINLAQIT